MPRVNVPKDIVDDLILASRKAIVQDTHGFFYSNGCYALPTFLIHQMLEVIETCIEGIPFVPNDEANSQARGLGNMAKSQHIPWTHLDKRRSTMHH